MAQLLSKSEFVSFLEVGDVIDAKIIDKAVGQFVMLYPKCKDNIVLLGEPYSCDDSYVAFKYLVSTTGSQFAEYLGIHSLESVVYNR